MQLTDDQKLEAERQELISMDGQVREFRDAIKQALNTVNLEIVANDGQPQVDAATRALISIHAEFIAMAPNRRARRMQMRESEIMLPRLVALRVREAGEL